MRYRVLVTHGDRSAGTRPNTPPNATAIVYDHHGDKVIHQYATEDCRRNSHTGKIFKIPGRTSGAHHHKRATVADVTALAHQHADRLNAASRDRVAI